MGLSGGTTNTSKSYSGSAQAWAQPIATGQANATTGVFSQNQPQLQALTDRLYQSVPGIQAQMGAGNPNVQAAQGYNTDILNGEYLSGNPMLQQMIDQAKRGVTDSVGSQFASAGRYGSGAFTDVLSRNLADAEGNMRFQDYNNQQGRMDAAAAQAPALAQANYIGLPELLQSSTIAAGLPYVGSSATANSLGALFNGGTQDQTQKTSPNILGGIGSAIAAAAVLSDRRLKRDIEKIGELDDGLGQYEWQYVWGGARHRGVMADEVAELRPWALGPTVSGYATVNYGAL